jgi:hypothetical protein
MKADPAQPRLRSCQLHTLYSPVFCLDYRDHRIVTDVSRDSRLLNWIPPLSNNNDAVSQGKHFMGKSAGSWEL